MFNCIGMFQKTSDVSLNSCTSENVVCEVTTLVNKLIAQSWEKPACGLCPIL